MIALGVIGFLAFIACLVILIVSAVRRRQKRYWAIGMGVAFVLFIVGMANSTPSPPSTSNSVPTPTSLSTSVTYVTTNAPGSSAPSLAPAPTPPAGNVTKVTAQELFSAYDANEVAADTRYSGKTIQVSGTVIEIGKDMWGSPYVMLLGGTTYLESLMGVQCAFSSKAEPELAQLTKGEKVTVQGKVSRYLADVYMEGCTLVR